jgi:hypothetical protein
LRRQAAVAAAQAPARPTLRPGEHYAGAVLDAHGQHLHHLVLLPDSPTNRLDWKEAGAWAESIGGSLPTRQELALLFGNCRQHFEPAWHWSSEQYSASIAWSQGFSYGNQNGTGKSAELRARAVRRV